MSLWQTLSGMMRAVLMMSVSGSAAALILFAIKPLIRNRIPKAAQYSMWLFVVAAFLLPLSVFITLPISTHLAPVQRVIEENVKSNAEWQEQLALELYGTSYAELDDLRQVNVTYREMPERRPGNFDFMIVCTFLLGMVYSLKEWTGYAAYLFKLRRSRLPAQREELALVPPGGPRLYRSALPTTPMLVGLFRPAIYLPDMAYTEAQLQGILSHELTHWRRHDVAVKWLATLAVHLHWFNPIAHLARREIDRACELACDEAVIKTLDPDGRQRYGDTLIEMAADTKGSKLIVSTTMCEEKKNLKERLGAIMRHQKAARGAIVLAAALLAAIIGIVVWGGASTVSKQYTEAELALLASPATPPDGLSLTITDAASGEGEFLLINETGGFVVSYAEANRVERCENGRWVAVTNHSMDLFPPTPQPLQPGEQVYGTVSWAEDGIALPAGSYRCRMVVQVRELSSGESDPVVLTAAFTLS